MLSSRIIRAFVIAPAIVGCLASARLTVAQSVFSGTLVSGRAYYRNSDAEQPRSPGGVVLYLVHGSIAGDAADPLKNQVDSDVTDQSSPSTLGMFSFATTDILTKLSIVHFADLESDQKPHFFSTVVFPRPTGSNTRLSAKIYLPLNPTGKAITKKDEAAHVFRGIILAYALGPKIEKDHKSQMITELKLLRAASREIPLDIWYPEALDLLKNSESGNVRKLVEGLPDLFQFPIDEAIWNREVEHMGKFRKGAG